MVKMITLFGREIKELSFNELKRERRCHSFLLTRIKIALANEQKELKRFPDSQIRQDKTVFFEQYKECLEAMIAECDYYLDRRYEPMSNASNWHPKKLIRAENAKRRATQIRDNTAAYSWSKTVEKQGFNFSWDRERFFLVANDRGYQTEQVVIMEVGKELKLDKARTQVVLNKGRFTWGQVLILGAWLQMTPKEFCDIFLAGYFTEQYGEYRADLENLNKVALLMRAIKPQPVPEKAEGKEEEEQDLIYVDWSGKPLDEEAWFD